MRAFSDADRFRATALSAIADAQRTRVQLDVSRNQESVTHAKRLTIEANLAQADAALSSAQAALDLAEQDQRNTIIRSSIDGVVGDRHVEPGDYVQPGTRLLTVVPMDDLYVIANFKESQTDRMVPGQEATVEIDALRGEKLQGYVERFAPGSGSQFSLLPFEPGTGNFTKIAQLVPVRIRFAPNQLALAALRPGLSSVVTVKLQIAPGQSRYSAGATEPDAPLVF